MIASQVVQIMIALTGDAGNDTFNVDAGSDTIADLATGDDLKSKFRCYSDSE